MFPETVLTGVRQNIDMTSDPETRDDTAKSSHHAQIDGQTEMQGGHPGTLQDDRHSSSSAIMVSSSSVVGDGGALVDIVQLKQ